MLGWILLLLYLIGLRWLVLGLRGRAIDDHPLCVRCGYDLSRLPADQCPECGSALIRAGAVRVGHRQRRIGLVVAGGLIVLAVGVAAAIAFAS
jgi:predicted RNA-binding Zn-ribbon protein involved in translation (DUF1610 family)